MTDADKIHVVLNDADFVTLISGDIVEKPGTRIILSDIGFGVMVKRLSEAMLESAMKTAQAAKGDRPDD